MSRMEKLSQVSDALQRELTSLEAREATVPVTEEATSTTTAMADTVSDALPPMDPSKAKAMAEMVYIQKQFQVSVPLF